MKTSVRICIFLIVFAWKTLLVHGQSPKIEAIKMLKNQKEVEVTCIFQETEGFIWIGTQQGLIRYDGVEFKLFTISDSLQSNQISCLGQDADGMLWIGHKNGRITRYSKSKFTKFNPEEGNSTRPISSFYLDTKGIMWFSTLDEGVYYFAGTHRKRLYNLNTDDGLLDNYVYSITEDTLGNYYFATDKGISVYHFESQKFNDPITMTDGLPDNLVKQVFIANHKLWIGMEEGGICSMDLSDRRFISITEWAFGSINSFVKVSDNEFWVSTSREGIIKCEFDANQKPWYSVYNKVTGLNDNRTNAIFLDRENNIWIGTKKGLCLRKNNNIEFLDERAGIPFTSVYSIINDKKGRTWIAAMEGLFVVTRDEMGHLGYQKLFDETKYQGISFISLYEDTMGQIWTGTYGYGVFKINPTNFKAQNFTSANGLTNDNVIQITGTDETIWLSTLGGGISKINIKGAGYHFDAFTEANGLVSNYVYYTFIDSKNRVWTATDGGGVVLFQNDSIHSLNHPLLDSIGKKIYSIAEDSLHQIWLNAADQGLIKYDGTRFELLTESEGLKSNSTQSMAVSNMGELVIVSNLGIQKYNPVDGLFESFGEEDGVAYLEPNLNCIYCDKNSNLWIGNSQGLIRFSSSNPSNKIQPLVVITNKSLFFNPISDATSKFRHNQNHLSFQYTGFWFKSSNLLEYRYTLKGYDIDWSPITNSRMVTYSNLPAGNFEFVVQVKHPNGTWISSDRASYSFKIKPPFYKTWWFISLSIVIIVIGIFVFIKARTEKLLRDRDRLEEEVKKRTAEIQKQKEEIEAQRDEIEAQRNHVIEQRDQIENQNKDIKASIQYASRIQRAVLPPLQNFDNLLGETFIFFKPRDIVSGDFYYLNYKYNKIIVAAADCTGHGVPGAFMSLLGISILNQIVSLLPGNFNAASILNELRSELKKSLRQTGKSDEAKDGMDISLCVIDKENRQLDYAGAFNPMLLVRNGEVNTYKADKMPIGIFIKEDEPFTNNLIQTQSGDMLYLYSDGFQDQFGGADKRKFLPKNLKELLLEISVLPLEDQKNKLDAAFSQWKANLSQVDDVLVMGIKIEG
ncbi:MAG TPA: hypothetical protein DCQ26_15555 [Marinilabiliales bacterium]|nr:MAG: hypothetical protein A2W95_14510 [Bacteroidetes bacterium GWA2_40_14]OFX60884.1 MAG: hypothetical protein A2W84_17585 [Bacteroidetes bacterium GWC2_40_13]OFX71538.1 MAG: hypothetical protein A2W96_10335 [Bacteroidetes bacterium GWD2_40_43]OFX95572.1 MAG: hypothetical protein A2W97_00655 [Bacteroidetes bacterium GWE2_40_63]OFY22270.1 MAG: hypothetical protein A2W88_07070 [Bacteroidetes bacterium GWF2_40_13]OFZ24906.1 MAG: hypothetical protein A2437_14705 [Bacteroidetes bacterium RIFOXYC